MTDAEKAAIVAQLPTDPRELLTAEERERLNADLQEIARTRRHAEAESAHIVLGRER